MDDKDYMNILVEHAKRLGKIPCCQSAQIVVCVASGVDLVTQAIYDHMRRKLPDYVITTDDFGGKRKHLMGIKPADREEMAAVTLNGFRHNRFSISPEFFTVTHSKGPESMLEMLGNQLKAVERRVKPGGTRVEYSGTGEHKTKLDGCSFGFMKLARMVEGFERLGLVVK